ncbi:MAG: alpha/beta fold hydrolase [Caldimonas sp.]
MSRELRAALALVLAIVLVGAAIRFVFPRLALSIALDLERSRSGLVTRSVTLPDGLRVAYLEGGKGEPLVLLHGFGGDKDNFTRIARFLTPQYHVIVPDLIGFGDSSHPVDADYSPPAQAERMRAFCQAIGVQAMHLGGSSMGGHVALAWTVLHPHEVQSLWLLDPGGVWSGPESEVRKTIRVSGKNPLLVASEDEFAALSALVMSKPPPIPRFLMDVLARERIRNRRLEERIFAQITADSVEKRIAGMRKVTLVVFGAEDRVIDPRVAQILRDLLPLAHVVVMPGVGHLPAIEAPAHTASDYIRFRDSM